MTKNTVGHLINGAIVSPDSRTLDINNPATGISSKQVCMASKATVEEAITVAEAPRVYGWTEDTEDLSGLNVDDDDWITRDAVPDTLRALLAEVGRVYVPFLLGNAAAIEDRCRI